MHIFTEEYRLYYDLERLWRDSKLIKVKPDSKKTESAKYNKDQALNEIDLEDSNIDINVDINDEG